MTVSFERVGVLVLSAALSAGMLAAVPAASAASSNCDELLSNYNPRVKHSLISKQHLAECEKSKDEKGKGEKGKGEKSRHGKGKGEKSKDDED